MKVAGARQGIRAFFVRFESVWFDVVLCTGIGNYVIGLLETEQGLRALIIVLLPDGP